MYTHSNLVFGEAPRGRASGVYTKVHEHARQAATKPKSKVQRVYQAVLSSPLGRLGLSVIEDAFITGLVFLDDKAPLAAPKTSFTKQVAKVLEAYFESKKSLSNLPVRLNGTPFQLKVWERLRSIPPGQALTYGDVAKSLLTGPRAVGNACRCNPIVVIVPCHRVIAANGGLGGFNGMEKGCFLQRKQWLLEHEGFQCRMPSLSKPS